MSHITKLVTLGSALAVVLSGSFNLLGDDSKNGSTVSITPVVKTEGKTKAWRSLASEVAENQKRADAQTAQDANSSILTPLLKGVTYDAGACLIDCEKQPCDENKMGVYGKIEYLSLTPYQSNNRVFNEEIDAANTRAIERDLDSAGSLRYELGYRRSPSCMGFRARYWHFDESYSGTFDGSGSDPYALWGNDTWLSAATNAYQALEDFDVRVVDVEAMRQIGCGTDLTFGVRTATFDQRYSGFNGTNRAFSVMEYEGTGPTVGITTQQNIAPCFYLYGGLRGSLLFGEQFFRVTSEETDTSIEALNNSALASSLDADVGLGYQRGCFRVNAGMEAQYWMNVGSANPSGYSEDSDSSSLQTGEDVGFIGWKIGAGFDF